MLSRAVFFMSSLFTSESWLGFWLVRGVVRWSRSPNRVVVCAESRQMSYLSGRTDPMNLPLRLAENDIAKEAEATKKWRENSCHSYNFDRKFSYNESKFTVAIVCNLTNSWQRRALLART